MYKVGDKVIFHNKIRTVKEVLDESSSHIVLDGDFYARKENVTPYQSAHDKLLALGWEEQPTTIKNNKRYDNEGDGTIFIDFEEKTYEAYENYEPYKIDLTLSCILTQYLEELEAKE